MKKKLAWSLVALLMLIAGTAVSVLTYVINTEQGLQRVSAYVLKKIPGTLSYDSLHGRLTDKISIHNLHYETADISLTIKDLAITLQLRDMVRGILHINKVEASGIQFTQNKSPPAQQADQPIQTADINIPKIPLSIKLDSGEVHDISIMTADVSQPVIITLVKVDGVSLNDTLTMQDVHIDAGDNSLSVKGSIQTGSGLPYDLQISWRTTIPGYTTVTGEGSLKGDLHQVEVSQSVLSPFTAQVHGTLSNPLITSQQRLQITAAWHDFNWPSAQTPIITSREGEARLEGNMDHYDFKLTTALENIPGFPAGKWTATGQGWREDMTLSQIDGEILQGKIYGKGKLRWQPQLAWQFSIDGRDINPGAQWPAWPGLIAFSGTVDGGLAKKGVFTTVDLKKASGKLRNYPLAMRGHLEWTPQKMSVSDLNINADNNIFLASGTLTDRWNISWDLNATEINALLPDAHGTIISTGKLIGPKGTPRLTMSGQGKQLAYRTYTAAALEVSADIDLLSKESSAIELITSDIHVGQLHLDEFELEANGMVRNHKLRAIINSGHTVVNIGIDGALQDKQWSGAITAADITSRKYGDWKLAKPIHYNVNAAALHIENGCWQNLPAQLCAGMNWQQNKGGHAALTASNIPLSLARRFLPPSLKLDGALDVQGNFDISAANTITGSAQVLTKKGHLSHTLSNGADIMVEYSEAVVTLRLDKDKVGVSANLNINNTNFIKASISLPQTNINIDHPLNFDNLPIAGQLTARFNDLKLLPYFTPEVENTQGTIKIDLALNGTTSHPQLKGLAQLDNGSAEIPRAGLHINDVKLTISGNDIDKLKIAGQAQSGEGTLDINGTVGWDIENLINAHIEITGKKFEVVKIPEIWITTSPDLTIEVLRHRIDVNGTIDIPEASINPNDLATTRRPSSDVVIENNAIQEVQKRWEIYSLINFNLGDKVKFDGFGLSGDIDGNVALIDAPNQLTTAYGQLQINKGIYQAYGQKLTIDRGRLLFVGGPVDNPGLDISAVRHIDTVPAVTAGVNIRGTLQEPVLHVFSDPAMADTDALSYLILGTPMSQASQSQGELLAGAATSIGLAGGEFVAKQIGKAFSIDDVHIDSGTTADESTLVVGKYLSPKLYVSYGIGLIEPINTFIVRYKLGTKWTVQSETGIHTGADLFYTLEK